MQPGVLSDNDNARTTPVMESSPHASLASSLSEDGDPYLLPEEDLRLQGENNRGYFPMCLGLWTEDNRYCIVRKLGWGQYSSVWMARDMKEKRFVSIKILTREATEALEDGKSNELDILRTIAESKPSHRGFRYNMLYYDAFKLQSPHGEHQCIVTEVLGSDFSCLRTIDDGRTTLQPSTVKHITRQLLMALEYLHNECHVIHGDIEHISILFRPKSLDDLISRQLAYDPSSNYDYDPELPPPVLPIMSQPLPLTIDKAATFDQYQLEAVLADFGSSHRISHHPPEATHVEALLAPEVVLGYEWNTPADIWALGCIVIELLSGRWLFDPVQTSEWSYDEDYLAYITEVLQTKFELDFLNKCKRKHEFFKEDGTFAHFTEHVTRSPTLKEVLDDCLFINEAERESAEQFLIRCLQLMPEMRPTATQLLGDPWLRD